MIQKRRKIYNFSPPPTFAQKTTGPQQLPVNINLRFKVPSATYFFPPFLKHWMTKPSIPLAFRK